MYKIVSAMIGTAGVRVSASPPQEVLTRRTVRKCRRPRGAAPAHGRQRAREGRGFFRPLAAILLALILPATGFANICDRTPAVYAAILEKIANIDNCADVSLTELRGLRGALDLSGLGLRELREDDFESLNNLEQLYLHDNALVSLPEDLFRGWRQHSLEYLDLSGNHLASLPPELFDDLSSLKVLRLNDNHLASLPAGLFDGVFDLTRLHLGENILASLPAGLFDGLTSLEHLNLSGNAFQSLPGGLFDGLQSLEMLWLSHNLLVSLPGGLFDGLTLLQTLSIDNNALTSLPSGLFNGLSNLQYLGLHENELAHLPSEIFKGLHLRFLRLDANRFRRLPEGIFKGLSIGTMDREIWAVWLSFHDNPKDVPELHSFTATLEAETDASAVTVKVRIPEGVPSPTRLTLTINGESQVLRIAAGGTGADTPSMPVPGRATIRLEAGTIGEDDFPGAASGFDLRVPAQTMVWAPSQAPTRVMLSVSPQVVDEDAGATTVTVTAQLDGNSLPAEADVAVTLSASGRSGRTVVSPERFVLSFSEATAEGTFTLTPSADDGVFGGDGVVTVSGTHPSLPVSTATVFVRDTFEARVSVSGEGEGLISRPDSSFSAVEGTSVTLTATSTDVLGAASFAWRQIPGDPVWVFLPEVATDEAELHIAFLQRSAPYTVRLSVTATHDPGAAPLIRSRTRNIVIEVAATDADPVIEQAVAMVGGDTSGTSTARVVEGTKIVLRGSASDADPDQRLTVEWSGPEDVPLSRVDPDMPGTVTFAAPGEVGRYTFTFSADDDGMGVGDPAVTREVAVRVMFGVSIRGLSPSVTEGGDARFEVRASEAPSVALTVDVNLSGGENFGVGSFSRVVIDPGETTALLSVPTGNDFEEEADGVLRAEIRAGADYAAVAPTFAEMAIIDIGAPSLPDVSIPDVSIPDVSIRELSPSVTEGGNARFEVRVSEAPSAALTVDIGLSGGEDFGVGPSTRVVFAPGETIALLSVPTENDFEEEADGVLRAELRAGTGYAVVAPAFAEMAIRDIGASSLPEVSIWRFSPSVTEGKDARFILSVNEAPSVALTVDIDLSGGEDFGVGSSSRAVFAPGETIALLSVPTGNDFEEEADGVLRAEIRAGANYAVVAPAFVEMAIRDNDVTISIAAQASSVLEGSDAVFVLTANEAPLMAFTVRVMVSATGGDHGVREGPRTMEFEAGATTATLRVETLGDNADEENGTATAALQAGAGYLVGAPATISVEIQDDDVTISIAAQASSVPEGSDAVFVLTVSKAPLTTFTAGVAVSASGGDHGVREGPRTVEFEVGATTATLNAETLGDNADEEDGTVTATLQAGVGYAVRASTTATVAVVDDDVTISVAPKRPTVLEGPDAVFVLTASKAPLTTFTVDVEVTATGGDHGVREGPRTVEFEAGAPTATLRVETLDDDSFERWGVVTAALQAGAGYAVGTPDTASATIADDDLTISFARVNPWGYQFVEEGKDAIFILTANETPQTTFTVWVAVKATEGHEVLEGPRTVEFEAGAPTATLRVETMDNNVYEVRYWVTAELQAGIGYALGTRRAFAAILDNDVTISIAAQASSVSEGEDAVFVLTANKTIPYRDITVGVAVTASGGDHGVREGPRPVEFEAWATTATLRVRTVRDNVDEENGTVTAVLQAGTRHTAVAPGFAEISIIDLGPPPEISIHRLSPSVTEGGDARFEVRANKAPWAALTVDIDLSGGEDFGVGSSSRVVFGPGDTTALLSVSTGNDFEEEADGVLRAELRAGADYAVGAPGFAEMAIIDLGEPPPREISIRRLSPSVTEGGDARFEVRASEAPWVALTVDIDLSGGEDFGVGSSSRAVFAPGEATALLTVPTVNDHQEEADGVLRAELRAGAGYVVVASAFAEMAIIDIGEPSPDVNRDDSIDAKDALILYYAYTLRGDVGAGR